MDNFYEYLDNKFGNCEILSDGTYYVKNAGNHYYFSSDCLNTDVNLMVCYPGIGGLNNESGTNPLSNWNYQLKSTGIPSGSVVMISASTWPDGYVDNFSVFDEVSLNTGINVSSMEVQGFSGSGGTVIVEAGRYLENHPELVGKTAIVDVDGYLFNEVMVKDPGASTFVRDNNIPIYMITPPHESYSNRVKGLTEKFTNEGFNTYLVMLEEKDFCIGHDQADYVVLNDGFSQYIGGVSNELGGLAGYHTFKYKDGELVAINLEDARVGEVNYIEINDIKKVLDENQFVFSEISNNVIKKYNGLLNKSDFDISYAGTSSKMVSDMEYIENFSNNLIGSLKDDSLFSSLTLSVSGGCGPLIEPINQCINLYYDAVGELINKLNLETESIVSIGQSIADMDMYLKDNAPSDVLGEGDLKEIPIVVPDEEVLIEIPAVIPSEDGSNNKWITEEGTILDESELGSPKDKFITDSGEFVEEEPIKQNEIPDNKDDLKINTQPRRQNNNNFISKEVVYEKNGYNLVLEVSDNEIISIKYRYEFISLEDAANNYNLLVEKYSSVAGIENIVLNGDKIDIVFNVDLFDDMNYNEILSMF